MFSLQRSNFPACYRRQHLGLTGGGRGVAGNEHHGAAYRRASLRRRTLRGRLITSETASITTNANAGLSFGRRQKRAGVPGDHPIFVGLDDVGGELAPFGMDALSVLPICCLVKL